MALVSEADFLAMAADFDVWKFETAMAMQDRGGSFVQALGVALNKADMGNALRLSAAFPELFAQYGPNGPFAKPRH